jgi:hypothetical protein
MTSVTYNRHAGVRDFDFSAPDRHSLQGELPACPANDETGRKNGSGLFYRKV